MNGADDMSRLSSKTKKNIVISSAVGILIMLIISLSVLSGKADANFQQGNLETAISQYKIVTTFNRTSKAQRKLDLAQYEQDAIGKIGTFYEALEDVKAKVAVSSGNAEIIKVTKSISKEFLAFDKIKTDLGSDVAAYVSRVRAYPGYDKYKTGYLTGDAVAEEFLTGPYDTLLGDVTKEIVVEIIDGMLEIQRPEKYFAGGASAQITDQIKAQILCRKCGESINADSVFCEFCGAKQGGPRVHKGIIIASLIVLIVIGMAGLYLKGLKNAKTNTSLQGIKEAINERKHKIDKRISKGQAIREAKREQNEIEREKREKAQERKLKEKIEKEIRENEEIESKKERIEGERVQTQPIKQVQLPKVEPPVAVVEPAPAPMPIPGQEEGFKKPVTARTKDALEIISSTQYMDLSGTNLVTIEVQNNTQDKIVKAYQIGFKGFDANGNQLKVGLAGGRDVGMGRAKGQSILPGLRASSGAGWYLDNLNVETLSVCIYKVEYEGNHELWINPAYKDWVKNGKN